MAFEIIDGNLVSYRTQHAVTIFRENQVAFTVHRPQQVVELVIELHREHFLETTHGELAEQSKVLVQIYMSQIARDTGRKTVYI